jgi:hypothetical protein
MSDTVFTTPGVSRIFIACDACRRVVPHYRVYGSQRVASGRCKCGNVQFRPTQLPEWKAAIWVLVIGWLWRKTIRKEQEWDPRMPIRQV